MIDPVNHQCDWSVVDQRDLHVGRKDSALHVDAAVGEQLAVPFVELLGDIWGRGIGKGGASSFAAITEQRELTDDEG